MSPQTPDTASHIRLRRVIAALLCLSALAPVLSRMHTIGITNVPIVAFIGMGGIALTAALLQVQRLEPQLMGRAVLWSVLVFGALVSFVSPSGHGHVYWISAGLTTGPALALLVLGMSGLDAPSAGKAFFPVAFRGVLLAIMVMALADTCSLLFWGGLLLEEPWNNTPEMIFMLSGGSAMLLAVYGLYRLRLWGFLLNVAANVAIAVFAWALPDIPPSIAGCLSATAAGQLIVGLPLFSALLKGDAAPAQMNTKTTRWVSTAVVFALLLGTELARVRSWARR